jgi:tRNA/tmRNA/rRNA uracil-C5-methylase (TrmA/RlmC/RlmD family)
VSTWLAAGLPESEPRVVAAERPTRYRNRLRVRIDEYGNVGFFNLEKALECAVVEASVLSGMRLLRNAGATYPGALALFSHAELRACDDRGMGGIVLYGSTEMNGERSVDLARLIDGFDGSRWNVTTAQIGLPCELPCQTWFVQEGLYLFVPLDAFMQINWPMNRSLVAHVVTELGRRAGGEFADFYMGVGNFALPLLAREFHGVGVEQHAGAARAAQQAAQQQGLAFEEVHSGDARQAARTWSARGRTFDFVIVDPPRAGLKTEAASFAQLTRNTLLVCSCNPNSLVVDVARILRSGFAVSSVTLFDMFPQTAHVEAVVTLDRT